MSTEFQDLFSYNRWANQRVLSAARDLPAEDLERDLQSSFPSILATLRHVLSAEWVWAERWQGASPTQAPPEWETGSVRAIEDLWREVAEVHAEFVARLLPDDLDRVMEYRNLQGVQCAEPLRQILQHVINHSTYHRGQLATMLRQVGVKPPATDLILYYRQKAAAPTPEARA